VPSIHVLSEMSVKTWMVETRPSHDRRSYFARFASPFFTPASEKTHMAASISTAMTITKAEKSGRIGEPLK
jgi:hypothetical protein